MIHGKLLCCSVYTSCFICGRKGSSQKPSPSRGRWPARNQQGKRNQANSRRTDEVLCLPLRGEGGLRGTNMASETRPIRAGRMRCPAHHGACFFVPTQQHLISQARIIVRTLALLVPRLPASPRRGSLLVGPFTTSIKVTGIN